jgi:deoxyribodipyrimidine photo-lyase
MAATLVWFRQDLRLADQPALHAAVLRGKPILPVFIWSPEEHGDWRPGAASCWWLHHSLNSLQQSLQSAGSRLVIRHGDSLRELRKLVTETRADAVYWTRRYEPAGIHVDATVKLALKADGLTVESFNGQLLFEPWDVKTRTGGPYKVFTPFWRACQEQGDPSSPLPAPERLAAPKSWPTSLAVSELKLLPGIPWDAQFLDHWQPGTGGVEELLQRFLPEACSRYPADRDFPALPGTSQLSPHLHWGEVSPRQVWAATEKALDRASPRQRKFDPGPFRRQLIWREFAHHLLYHFPHTPLEPLRPEFADFPWRENAAMQRAWERGETGYPIVDAGMRQLWATGWMHNRVRMIVGSFLVKDLLLPWQVGARWFWDTLVDADLANNTLGWQWIGGCGADAAPYFRIFNPITQAQKFDPAGEYIRRWVPELAELPAEVIHSPWTAGDIALRGAKVQLGKTYPRPCVDHAMARSEALAALAVMGARRGDPDSTAARIAATRED